MQPHGALDRAVITFDGYPEVTDGNRSVAQPISRARLRRRSRPANGILQPLRSPHKYSVALTHLGMKAPRQPNHNEASRSRSAAWSPHCTSATHCVLTRGATSPRRRRAHPRYDLRPERRMAPTSWDSWLRVPSASCKWPPRSVSRPCGSEATSTERQRMLTKQTSGAVDSREAQKIATDFDFNFRQGRPPKSSLVRSSRNRYLHKLTGARSLASPGV